MTKVLVIFPKYSAHDASHYPYWYQLFHQASRSLNLLVLFESGHQAPQSLFPSLTQRFTQKPLNLIERFFLILHFRLQGYTRVYIHYSYFAVFLTRLLKLFFPLTLYYWNCEKYSSLPPDRLLPLALASSDVVVTGHSSLAPSYRRIFSLKQKPIRIVPNFVSPIHPQTIPLDSSLTHILFLHHLSPRKGSRDLPAIISSLLRHNPTYHFHIIGSGPDASWLQTQLHPHRHHLTLHGYLSQPQALRYLASSNYFILPSRSEGFPRVILEAMILKVPFVATRVGCIAHIISHLQHKFIVPPNQPTTFVHTFLKLTRYSHKKALTHANYQQAKQYNLRFATAQFLQLFHDQN